MPKPRKPSSKKCEMFLCQDRIMTWSLTMRLCCVPAIAEISASRCPLRVQHQKQRLRVAHPPRGLHLRALQLNSQSVRMPSVHSPWLIVASGPLPNLLGQECSPKSYIMFSPKMFKWRVHPRTHISSPTVETLWKPEQ